MKLYHENEGDLRAEGYWRPPAELRRMLARLGVPNHTCEDPGCPWMPKWSRAVSRVVAHVQDFLAFTEEGKEIEEGDLGEGALVLQAQEIAPRFRPALAIRSALAKALAKHAEAAHVMHTTWGDAAVIRLAVETLEAEGGKLHPTLSDYLKNLKGDD